MSDEIIRVILKDARKVPTKLAQEQALEYASNQWHKAESITNIQSEEIQFFDCAGDFLEVYCPKCKTKIEIEDWQEYMDSDYKNASFELKEYSLKCCNAKANLNELIYEKEQGFGRYCLEIINPNISEIAKNEKLHLEEIFEEEVRIIYQHL
jgi:hypothetical protein